MKAADRITEPLASHFVRRTCLCWLSCVFLIFAMSGLAAGLGYVTLMTRDDVWMILDGEMTQHRRAYQAAREQVRTQSQAAEESSGDEVEMLTFFYKSADGTESLFTPDRLVDICEMEKTVVNNTKIQEVVFLGSVLRLFYGTAANPAQQSIPAARLLSQYNWSCEKLPQSIVDDTVDFMYNDMRNKGPQSLYATFVDPSFPETKKNIYSRTALQITVSPDSGEEAMAPVFEHLGLSYALLKSAFQGEEDRFVPSGNIRVRLIFSGINEIQKMAMPDFLLSFISVILVFGIVYLHTKSSIIAASSMFMMIMTLPVAALVYQGVLRVQYFEFLHILVVYLVLGIGADDIFVFKDTFCHIVKAEFPFVRGGRLSEEQEIKALSLTFQRAGVAIFNTSFTTALAFASCSVSRCMPMRTCGWYAATCIVTLYVLTLTYFPPVLLFWHRRLQAKRCCCPTLKQREFAIVPVDEKPLAEESAGPVELFFEKVYIPVMSKKVGPVRIFALILFLIMFGVAVQGISFALQLTPPRSEEVWFPGNHMFVGIQDFMAENFYTPAFDNYAVITVIFGIAGLDTSGINVYDPGAFIGTPIFDDSFDLTTSEAQTGMLDICSKLRTITCDLEGCDNSGYDTFVMQTTERTVSCFLEDFQQWLGGPLPTGANFTTQLQAFRSAADKGQIYGDVLVKAVNYKTDIGFIDGELKYVALHFRSVMKKRLPFSIGTRIRDHIREWMDANRGALPSSLKSMKFHGNGEFQRYDMGEELINGLFSGIAIAMPISFLVLLSSTQNVVVAIYAVLSVGAIVLCVLGFCKSAMDWDLGVGEAIAGVIVIGYSVDYVVHLAHMYSEGMHFGHQTRDERAKFAIRSMGSTIFAGAITTMLAGATMFVCWFYFFIKMALLICVTIMYSFLFSLVFFMSLLWTAGPENSFGHIPIDRWWASRSGKKDTGLDAIDNNGKEETNTSSQSKNCEEDLQPKEIDEGPRTIVVP
ncbi:unnamed protein product [Durusdinium trenchii]|uniref:SSD domain-containing protein n=1 Tax=Durusdinium trenchii TaxID=1381693 RepID=A0ABP0IHR2_9DINO